MAGARDEHGLTPKQAKAVAHFVEHGDMSAAYRHAYNAERMKLATINRNAFDLFQVPPVAARVQALREDMAQASKLTREEALEILAKIARANLTDYLDASGEIDPKKLPLGGPDLEQIAITESEMGVARKLKVRNPIQAIERIARMCGWDKQLGLDSDGITINLNLGDDT